MMKHKTPPIMLAIATLLCSCSNEPIAPKESAITNEITHKTKEEVLIDKAIKARNFFYTSESRSSTTKATVSHYILNESRSTPDTVLSVVNFNENNGFVILTNRADCPELLAISDNGNIQLDDIDNPSLRQFIDGAIANLSNKPTRDITPLDPTRPYLYEFVDEYDTIYNVSPMIDVRWGQSYPYNTYCPIQNGIRTPAGCGPTAAAQIMTHYQHPKSFVWDLDEDGISKNTSLDWDKILQHKSSGTQRLMVECWCNNETHTIIGKLIRKLGDKMNAVYYPTETRTTLGSIRNALQEYGYRVSHPTAFGSDSKASTFNGSSIWIVIGTHTNANENNQQYSHFFVVDGRKYIIHHHESYIADPSFTPPLIIEYDEYYTEYLDYIHINWGWDGTANGYYYNGTYDSRNPHSLDFPAGGNENFNFTTGLYYITVSH